MSYQNPTWAIHPSFNIFGEGTFRFVDHECFDWTDKAMSLEKLTNEGWIEVESDELVRVLNKRKIQLSKR
jgi:hypothetical protein